MERKCWSSGEAQSRVAGEEGPLPAAPGAAPFRLPPTLSDLREIPQPGRPGGKHMTPSVHISTVGLSRHSEGEEMSHRTMCRV